MINLRSIKQIIKKVMGIKDLNPTLEKICPDAFTEVPLSVFKGYAIGIDASHWLFKSKSSAMKDSLRISRDPLEGLDPQIMISHIIKQFYGFVFKLCNAGVTPVWIFDGDTHPEKIACEKRKELKEAKKVSISETRERLAKLSKLEREIELAEYKKKLLGCISVTRDEIKALSEEVTCLGLPKFYAPHDGEIFASALSRNRLLVGVWTEDTDTYPAGALVKFSSFGKSSSLEGVKVQIFVPSVFLDAYSITREEFRDFCILQGCDFNNRIPKLGPATILKKMEEYEWNLERFMREEPDKPWEMINLEECRKIFDGPDVSKYQISDMHIDKVKWSNCMRTKAFEMDLPPNPRLVKLVE